MNVFRAGIAAVAGISPMVGAVIAVGMGREEFVVTYSMWLVGASPSTSVGVRVCSALGLS